MKMDALTLGTVGFAAFAAWAYLKPKQGAASVPQTGILSGLVYEDPFAAAKSQKSASAGAQWQNTDYLSAWTTPTSYANGLAGALPVYSWSYKP